ncbi:MAG: nicotinate-nucleotide adenylyltransferase [Pseudomonadota bacterium]|jgi:nicotinate-nucleotide adenylyltransferase|nr:nicotinate-nucleotide adenylyltransferase [Pseudomonadota bacterium]
MIGTNSRNRAIGLLGGSFNPAHDGHLMISLIALKRLQLDEVWWLVSPQNPLKSAAGMAPFSERLANARTVATHRRIIVSDIERRLGTYYTRDTLKRLCASRRGQNFVWLMGADNLVQFPKWEGWKEIFNTVPIAIFDRPTYSSRALAGIVATRFADRRIPERDASGLVRRKAPSWVFLHSRLNPVSATKIRAQNSNRAHD